MIIFVGIFYNHFSFSIRFESKISIVEEMFSKKKDDHLLICNKILKTQNYQQATEYQNFYILSFHWQDTIEFQINF